MDPLFARHRLPLSRRRFVTGLTAGSLAAASLPYTGWLRAATRHHPQPGLSGSEFDLTLAQQPVNLTGKSRPATTVNGSLPAPILRWREGQRVTLKVTNRLPVPSSIHWHGLILPAAMDGVPGLSFGGIAPGETFTYRFPVRQSGTYWYHSHSGFQEQTGLYGAIVIEPALGDPHHYQRDYVVVLSDWSDESPETIYATLKKQSHYYNIHERTLADLWGEMRTRGVAATWRERQMWNQMRMSDRDLSDVTGYTYTFLMNGQPPASGWFGEFRPGERVRLRFINSSAMTFFDLRIPGLKMTLIAADGQEVEPVEVDELRIGVAETYDVLIEPDERAYCLFAQALDRSGYALGTLAPDPSLHAEVPPLDPLPILSHQDMGMAMDHAAMGHSGMPPGAMDSGAMDHSPMQHGAMASPTLDADMDMGSMRLDDPDPPASRSTSATPDSPLRNPDHRRPVTHAPTEYGPQVDMRADAPRARLDDPGVGLRGNGRRVLTYADLVNRYPTLDNRAPEREIELHLTGNMQRYMWSIDGVRFADAKPLQLRYGERLRIILVNDTMMNHPIHLHGMWSELETGDPRHLPRKHTVVVQPGARISYLVSADARGEWAYHCHLLYHMPGMFRQVSVT